MLHHHLIIFFTPVCELRESLLFCYLFVAHCVIVMNTLIRKPKVMDPVNVLEIQILESVKSEIKPETTHGPIAIKNYTESLEMQTPEDGHQSEDESFTWSRKSTFIFLDCIERRKLDFQNPKIKKKELWKDIKNEMMANGFKINEALVERKFRNMKGTFKTIKENKRKSIGRGEVKWEYFEVMERIFEDDKTINGHTISSSPPISAAYTLASTSSGTNGCYSIEDASSSIEQDGELKTEYTFSLKTPKALNTSLLNISESNIDEIEMPKSSLKAKREKADRAKQLYGLRKKQIEIEETRIRELQLLTEAIEENNRIQKERNNILRLILDKTNK